VNIRTGITLILFLKINEKYGERYNNILLYVATHLSKIKLWNTFGLFPCLLIPYSRNTRELNWRVFLYSVLMVGFFEIPRISSKALLQYLLLERKTGFQNLLQTSNRPIFYSDCPNGSKSCIWGNVCHFRFPFARSWRNYISLNKIGMTKVIRSVQNTALLTAG
jgi:hypothetical protein